MQAAEILEEGDPALDGRLFRRCLGQLGTGVSLITTAHEGQKAGVTVNSVASVSLDPPLVLWSINKTSRSRAIFEAAKGFAINILAWDQMEVSRHFSSNVEDKFSGIPTSMGSLGFPLINGAIAQFECTLESAIEGGDHIILVGRVAQARRHAGDPLLFVQGRYAVAAEHPHATPAPEMSTNAAIQQKQPVEARFVQLVFDAHNALSAKFEAHRAAEGMTLAVARTITTLTPGTGMTLEALASRTYLGERTAEDTLLDLEKQHLVVRDAGGEWSLTDTGTERREAIYQRWLSFQDEQLEGIRPADVEGALRALSSVVDQSILPSNGT